MNTNGKQLSRKEKKFSSISKKNKGLSTASFRNFWLSGTRRLSNYTDGRRPQNYLFLCQFRPATWTKPASSRRDCIVNMEYVAVNPLKVGQYNKVNKLDFHHRHP